jgi:hypothetical protein
MRHDHAVILERCRNGGRLCKTITTNRAGNPATSYCLEPSGDHVSERQALDLLRSGKFTPVGDGLLGPDSSQTLRHDSSDQPHRPDAGNENRRR